MGHFDPLRRSSVKAQVGHFQVSVSLHMQIGTQTFHRALKSAAEGVSHLIEPNPIRTVRKPLGKKYFIYKKYYIKLFEYKCTSIDKIYFKKLIHLMVHNSIQFSLYYL